MLSRQPALIHSNLNCSSVYISKKIEIVPISSDKVVSHLICKFSDKVDNLENNSFNLFARSSDGTMF